MKFGSQIDTMGIPTKGLTPEQGTAFPANPWEGRFFHRTDQNAFFIYLGGQWRQCDNQGVAAASHIHAIAEVTGLQAALDAKAPTSRSISAGAGLTGGGNLTADRTLAVDFGANGGTSNKVPRDDDPRLSNARTPTAHGHAIADVSGLQTALNGKAASVHTHGIDDVTGLRSSLDGKSDQGHGHAISGISGLQTALDAKADKTYVDAAVQGIRKQFVVEYASTGNVAMTATTATTGFVSSAATVNAALDGLTVDTSGKEWRVLLKDQSSPAQNGLWAIKFQNAGSGPGYYFGRVLDANDWSEIPGAFVFVQKGTQADTGWVSTADDGGTLGTTAIPFVQFSAAGQILAGSGLTKSGNTLAVKTAGVINIDGTGAVVLNPSFQQTIATKPSLYGPVDAPALTAGQWVALGIYSGRGPVTFYENGEQIMLDYRWTGSGAAFTPEVRAGVSYGAAALQYSVIGF